MDAATFYDQEYWGNGKHAGDEMPERTVRKVLAPILGRGAVLDYGCGLGCNYQRLLAASVDRYVGADASSMAVEAAHKRGLEAVPVDTANGTVPLPTASFDGAVCSEVLEHLFDPLSAARELNRVLKPGGVLVATVPNFGYHTWRLLALLRAQVPHEPEDVTKDRYRGVHIRFFSKLMFKRMLRDAGFVNIKIGSFDDGTVWDIFKAMGHFGHISKFARNHFPAFLHLRFLQDLWPNVFALRLRAVAWKPETSDPRS
jgi:SAM-dependent methyltransferase